MSKPIAESIVRIVVAVKIKKGSLINGGITLAVKYIITANTVQGPHVRTVFVIGGPV